MGQEKSEGNIVKYIRNFFKKKLKQLWLEL